MAQDPVHPAEALVRVERFGYAWGFVCIFVGGLVAAVTRPLHLDSGSWLAAYLVLVAGVAQLVLAKQRTLLDSASASSMAQRVPIALWAAGNVVVIAGSLTHLPLIVDVGGAALAVALILALWHTRTARRIGVAWLVRAFSLALLVSVPVGLVLAQLRAP